MLKTRREGTSAGLKYYTSSSLLHIAPTKTVTKQSHYSSGWRFHCSLHQRTSRTCKLNHILSHYGATRLQNCTFRTRTTTLLTSTIVCLHLGFLFVLFKIVLLLHSVYYFCILHIFVFFFFISCPLPNPLFSTLWRANKESLCIWKLVSLL